LTEAQWEYLEWGGYTSPVFLLSRPQVTVPEAAGDSASTSPSLLLLKKKRKKERKEGRKEEKTPNNCITMFLLILTMLRSS
jgi:hypothetical protein